MQPVGAFLTFGLELLLGVLDSCEESVHVKKVHFVKNLMMKRELLDEHSALKEQIAFLRNLQRLNENPSLAGGYLFYAFGNLELFRLNHRIHEVFCFPHVNHMNRDIPAAGAVEGIDPKKDGALAGASGSGVKHDGLESP